MSNWAVPFHLHYHSTEQPYHPRRLADLEEGGELRESPRVLLRSDDDREQEVGVSNGALTCGRLCYQ